MVISVNTYLSGQGQARRQLKRINQLVAHGGHDVPLAVLRRRFPKSLGLLLTTYAAAVDETLCYLNSGTEPELVFHQQGSARTIDNPALFGLIRDLSQ